MRARRTTRIGPDDVDRLLVGDPTGPDHRGLAALLDAARAAPSPGELAGEQAAVAGFRAAYREAEWGSPARGRNRARRPLTVRMGTLKVAASVAILAVGGTAVAAETGTLPATAQRHAHNLFADLGVPPPRPAPTRPSDVPGGPAPGISTTPGAGSAPSASPTTTGPSAAATPSPTRRARGLCTAWDAQRRPHGKAMSASARRELAELAGAAGRIEEFCAPHLDEATPEPTATPSASATKGHGNGNGNDGNGNSNGNGNPNGNGTSNTNGNGNPDPKKTANDREQHP